MAFQQTNKQTNLNEHYILSYSIQLKPKNIRKERKKEKYKSNS